MSPSGWARPRLLLPLVTVIAGLAVLGGARLSEGVLGATAEVGAGLALVLTLVLVVVLGDRWSAVIGARWSALAAEIRRVWSAPEGGERVSELRPPPEQDLARAVNEVLDHARADVQRSEADRRLLTSLIEHSPNGVLVCDLDGRILRVNTAFCELFGLRGPLVGRLAAEVLTAPEALELLEGSSEIDPDDERFAVVSSRDLVLRPITTGAGEVALLAQDVTRFRSAERSRTAFVANISHELRTPMAAILGFADTLAAEPDLPEQVRPSVDALCRNSRRLRDTFEGLMHLARVEARSGQLTVEDLRIAPLMAEALAGAADMASAKGLSFAVDCPEELRASINAEAFTIIVGNLVMNAVKYTPPGGEVEVTAASREDGVEIAFRDTGVGIDPAHQERIFERFFRVDEGRDRATGGAGLGLAMVKHLCLATGARIRLVSSPSVGSTFIVTFPHPRGLG